MQVHWAYFDCGKEHEEQVQRHWEDRQRQLLARVEALNVDPAEVEFVVDRQDESPRWQIQAAMHLPAQTVVRRVIGDDPADVIAGIITDLIEDMDRVGEQPVGTTGQHREGLDAIVPILQRCHEKGRSDVFFGWLIPAVADLAAHARREIALREIEGDLASGQIVPADVLDEVLMRAYDRFDERPTKLPLDLWLMRLADGALEEQGRSLAKESLDRPIAKPSTEPPESTRDSWTEWATFSETIELGDVLPAKPQAETWDSLDLETKKTEMNRMLARIPRQQRQAMVLHAVYGYPAAEIADFQDRSEENVQFDIERGRYDLERHFLQEFLPEVEEVEERAMPADRRSSRRGIR